MRANQCIFGYIASAAKYYVAYAKFMFRQAFNIYLINAGYSAFLNPTLTNISWHDDGDADLFVVRRM